MLGSGEKKNPASTKRKLALSSEQGEINIGCFSWMMFHFQLQ